jgi:hypothetical protein
MALAACAQQPAGVVPSGNEAYKIGPLDVLDVTVFKVPDLSKTVQVDRNGTITYPLIGEIPAAGKTARELARDLAQRLNAKYLRSPQITITIKQYNNKQPRVYFGVFTFRFTIIRASKLALNVLWQRIQHTTCKYSQGPAARESVAASP